MNRVRVINNSAQFRELEIVAKDNKWFWIGWTTVATAIFALGWRELPPFKTIFVPLWLLWAIGLTVCELKGWMSIVWSQNGIEVLKVFSDSMQYQAIGGSFLDRKQVTLLLRPGGDPVVDVLAFGLGGNATQNRIRIKAARRTLYLGRDLSSEEARTVQGIIVDWLGSSSRSQLISRFT